MPISTIRTQQLKDIPPQVDLLVCACGYESRSTYIAKNIGRHAAAKLALGFDTQRELKYQDNIAWFRGNGFEVRDHLNDDAFEDALRRAVQDAGSRMSPAVIVVDISCLTRARLARLVQVLNSREGGDVDVSFAYNLAKFSPAADETAPTTVAEPVLPQFAGWTSFPENPPAAILGLGYEPSRAIGIVDHLEINNAAWAFVPQGPIPEYTGSVETANSSLFDMIGIDGRRLYYDVMDPGSLFRELNALVDQLKEIYNPILIPFGPKIFALVSLLAASLHEDVGVWRISSGVLEPSVDRIPSDFTTVLRAMMTSG